MIPVRPLRIDVSLYIKTVVMDNLCHNGLAGFSKGDLEV